MGRFNIKKGERFKIAKSAGLENVQVNLGWYNAFDLDISAFLIGEDGLIIDDADFVYYNSELRSEPFDRAKFGNKVAWRQKTRPVSGDYSVYGSIDDRDGMEGNDSVEGETMDIVLSRVRPEITEIVFVATIHGQGTFSDVERPYVTMTNADNGEELCYYDLSASFGTANAVELARLVIDEEGEWAFEAIDMPHDGGIETLIEIYAGE